MDHDNPLVDEHHVPPYPSRHLTAVTRISWGAIFAGAIIAVVMQFLLNLLGLGVGLTTFEFTGNDDSAGGFGMAQGIWTIISALIALFAGGWVAAHLAGMPRRTDGILHGAVTWALTTLLTLYILTTGVGAIVSGTTSLLSQGMNLAGQGVAAVAPGAATVIQENVDLSGLKRQGQALVADIAANPSQAGAAIDSAIDETFGGPGPISASKRQELIDTIVAQTGMSEAEARESVRQWESQYEQARQQITQASESVREQAPAVAESAADYVGGAALIAFFAILLGLVAAAAGGAVGAPREYPDGTAGRAAAGRYV